MKSFLTFALFFILTISNVLSKSFEVSSPDNSLHITVTLNDRVSFNVEKNGNKIILDSYIALQLNNETTFGINPVLDDIEEEQIKEQIINPVPTKSRIVENYYNKLLLELEDNYSIEFRAYNDGFAYRFISDHDVTLFIEKETMDVQFGNNYKTYFPEEESIISHNERIYKQLFLNDISEEQFCSLPMIVKAADNNINILITDADLFDYPNMFLKGDGKNSLSAMFPKKIKEIKPQAGNEDRNEEIISEYNYIAATNGERSFPWRTFVITDCDEALVASDLVFKLSRENKIEDPSWIKPGKIAWDWWNANNIHGVDFKSGLNTQTYKYYIDFASEYGLDYIILDEGWSKSTTDLTDGNENLDVKELINYGKKKGVGIILWALWKPLYTDLEMNLDNFQKWGAAGTKVDFMQRGDQNMVNIYEKIAKECAKRNLMVDYHGAYKPSGLRRAYPNVVNYEGVKGLENCKWSDVITPEHNLMLPFTRMVAGPLDYTPGAMVNKNKINYDISFERPMSMGTRCHQVAMYAVYEAPLQMLADSPSNYIKESETTKFIAQFPTVWDTTIVKDAEIGEYIIVARKNGNKWYLGAMTNSTPKKFEITLDFLPAGNYSLEIMEDGINCDRYAEDYKHSTINVKKDDKIKMNLASGGGWAGIITKK